MYSVISSWSALDSWDDGMCVGYANEILTVLFVSSL